MMRAPEYLPEWFMDRYRGRRGFFGWLVLKADARFVRYMASIAIKVKQGRI